MPRVAPDEGHGRPIRVGLVMHGLDRPLTGVTRVALELGRALAGNPRCDVVFLTTYRRGPFVGDGSGETAYLRGCNRVPGLMMLGGPLIAAAARRFALDVVHDPVGVAPFTLGRSFGSFRRVLTIHDAIAFQHPRAYSWANNFLHRVYVPATLRNVDAVITVSDHARSEIARYLPVADDRLCVVPNAVGLLFRPVPALEAAIVARRYGIEPPYLLHVGTWQPRKNIAGLVDALALLHRRRPELHLALVGPSSLPPDALVAKVRERGLSHAVTFVGPVVERDLPAIYSAASLFAFPSFAEGFGLPVLEAMACGTPVVSSHAASLPEVAGDAALLVDPADSTAFAGAAERILSDDELRATLITRGAERARSFSWVRAADATVDIYQHLLDQRQPSRGRPPRR